MSTKKTPPIVRSLMFLTSLLVFIVGFWHAHLGLKNQNFFGSEYGSLFIALIIVALLLLSYYFAINGKKIALLGYLICATVLIVYNLNYFYPYDFKEDLVREDAAILKDSLQSYSRRCESITSIKSEAEKDYRNLTQLKEQIYNEIKDMGGAKSIARGKIAEFNNIVAKYGVKEVKPSLIGVTDFEKQADLVDVELKSALTNFVEVNNAEGVSDAKAKIDLSEQLTQLKSKYTPVLEFIQRDTTKIDISNDKKNIENNPKNIAKIADIVSQINTVTKSVNEIYRNKNEKEPFTTLEATITKLGTVGHTIPSITHHIKHGTKEQKVGAWKNLLLCLFLDLIVPFFIYLFIRRKDDELEDETSFFSLIFSKNKNFNKSI